VEREPAGALRHQGKKKSSSTPAEEGEKQRSLGLRRCQERGKRGMVALTPPTKYEEGYEKKKNLGLLGGKKGRIFQSPARRRKKLEGGKRKDSSHC